MAILDFLKIPIKKVTSDKPGAYKSFASEPMTLPVEREPVKLPVQPKSPLQSLMAPISSVTPVSKATEAPVRGVAPLLDTSNPLSFLSQPIGTVTGRPEVRRQEWKDVANLPTQIGGFVIGPAIDAFLSVREALTGKRGDVKIKNPFPEQGSIPADEPVPDWFRQQVNQQEKQSVHPVIVEDAWEMYKEETNKNKKYPYSSETSQQYYVDQLDAGVPEKQAFWNTALKTVLDLSILVPLAKDVGKMAILRTAPEKLIDPRVMRATRQELRDFVSGAVEYAGKPSPITPEIQKAFKAATAQEKIQMLKGAGIEVTSAQPSRLGQMFGITQQEAESLLRQLYGAGPRQASAGALPGYIRDEPVPAFGLSTERRKAVGFGSDREGGYINLEALKDIKITPLKEARVKLEQTGSAEVLAGRMFSVVLKSDGDLITVKYGPKDNLKIEDVPTGERTFNTTEDAIKFAENIQNEVAKTQAQTKVRHIEPALQPLAVRAQDVTREQFVAQFQSGLTSSNPTTRQQAQFLKEVMKRSGYQTVQDFYDKIVRVARAEKAPKKLPSADNKIPKELDPLAKEARKYKSAEEFVGGQPTLYRGVRTTPRESASLEFGKGVYTTSDRGFAGKFGDVNELFVKPETRLINAEKAIPQDVAKIVLDSLEGVSKKSVTQLLKENPNATFREVWGASTELTGKTDNITNALKNNGFGGISFEGSTILGRKEFPSTLIFDDTNILTKSQLTDIWEGANQSPTPPTATKKAPKPETTKRGVEAKRENVRLEQRIDSARTYEQFFEQSGVTQGSLDATAKSKGYKSAKDMYKSVKDALEKIEKYRKDAEKALGKPIALTTDEKRIIAGDDRMYAFLKKTPPAKKVANNTLKQLSDTERYLQIKEGEEYVKPVKIKDIKKEDGETINDVARKVPPPAMKNGLQVPEMDFLNWKDKGALLLSRDTLERNIEKVVGKADQETMKEFLVEATRTNETNRTKFANELRDETRDKMKVLGIRAKSRASELVQRYGEGSQGEFPITLQELKDMEPNNWPHIKEAAEYFRGKYNMLLKMVNTERMAYGYEIIPARPDYFRHFQEMDGYLRRFGIIMKKEDLPGELAGITGIFRPGKPFSTAEMKRKGKKTTIDAIGGFDNYIDTITKQIFHINSVQRGRVVEKYMRDTMKAVNANAMVPSEQLNLGNFANNIKETTNTVSGKKTDFDRAFESRFGRRIYMASDWLRQRTSANMVGANIASALTNYAPLTQALATTGKPYAIRGLGEGMMLPGKKEPLKIDGVESGFLTRRFPIESIDPRGLKKASEKAAWVFRGVDQFVSTTIVAGKYYENIAKGMSKEAAMKDADAYAGKMIADRSAGQMPLIISDKAMGFMTQFQLEVNNVWSYMINDIPNMSEGNKLKFASMLSQFILYSYLFNSIYEKITGRRPVLDPIYAVLTLAGATDESNEATIPRKIYIAGANLLGNAPFIGGFTGGRFPVVSVLPDVPGILQGDTTWLEELKKSSMIVLPFGGLQLKKIYAGIDALVQGYTETTSGERKTDIEVTPTNVIKGAIFGPGGLEESVSQNPIISDLYTRLDTERRGSAVLTKMAEDLDEQLQGMESAEANARVKEVKQKDPQLYERLKKVVEERKLGLTQQERLVKGLGVSNGERARYVDEMIMRLPQEERNDYLKQLVDKKVVTPAVLDQIKEIRKSGESSPGVPEGTEMKTKALIEKAITYGKAIGTDPVTAFNRIFTGQAIRYVANDAIVVERLSLGESEQEARSQLMATSTENITRQDVKLDHTVPLQLGGSNSSSNLRLITNAEWASYTPVENFLGDALREERIDKKTAQDLIKKFKSGEITADEVYQSVGE